MAFDVYPPPPLAMQFSLVGYFEALAPSMLSVTLFFFSLVGGKVADFYEL